MEKNIINLIEYPKQGILSKEIIKNEKIDISLFCMSRGMKISEHTSTKPAVVYVIEGEGIFNLKGKDIKMERGIIIYMDKNAVHSLKAKEDTSFLLILIGN